ncbi:MAG: 4-alpha-glucanotransferase, partial [Rhodobacteraceae bacterium]|nr:4-alpha-glucanotransferase [Paracoccaceae bacterium]
MSVLYELAAEVGLRPGYSDQTGTWREAPPESIRAALAAAGVPADGDGEAAEALAALRTERAARALPDWMVAEAGAALRIGGVPEVDWRLLCEDGSARDGRSEEGAIDLGPVPAGRHCLTLAGRTTWVLAAPPRLPPPERGWGVTLPLYGLPPGHGAGFGSYGDLSDWAAALGRAGADFVGLNPVHAGFPEDEGAFSPYSPSHRRRFSTLHIPAGPVGAPLPDLVDYAQAARVRRAALEAAFAAGPEAGFAAWREAEGEALELFAVHQAISELHGPYWNAWPAALRDPASAEVARFAADRRDRVAFHAWLQWRAEAGLAGAREAARAAGMRRGLYLDLAVGTHPFGAETWAERALFAPGVSLGSPPDAFSPDGQTWGVAPFAPRWPRAGSRRWPRRSGSSSATPGSCASTISSASSAPSGCRRGCPGSMSRCRARRCWRWRGSRRRGPARPSWARTSATSPTACRGRWRPRGSWGAASRSSSATGRPAASSRPRPGIPRCSGHSRPTTCRPGRAGATGAT